jgi:hypothetical protein
MPKTSILRREVASEAAPLTRTQSRWRVRSLNVAGFIGRTHRAVEHRADRSIDHCASASTLPRPSGRDERDHTIVEIFPKNNLGECLSRLLGPDKHALTGEITVDCQPNEKRPGTTSPAVIRCKIAAGLAQMAVQERANQSGDKAENENSPHAEFGNDQNAADTPLACKAPPANAAAKRISVVRRDILDERRRLLHHLPDSAGSLALASIDRIDDH